MKLFDSLGSFVERHVTADVPVLDTSLRELDLEPVDRAHKLAEHESLCKQKMEIEICGIEIGKDVWRDLMCADMTERSMTMKNCGLKLIAARWCPQTG